MGMATAMALVERCRGKLVVLEAEERLAAHQTGHNIGVIHSGLYYRPGSLKARNCTEGRDLLYRFCQEHGIACEQCGKIVVATGEDELGRLAELERRGAANGLVGLRRLSREELKEYEPHAAGIAGLFVEQTGITDYVAVTEAFARVVREAGGAIKTRARVRRVEKKGSELWLQSEGGDVGCRFLINCGGLYCDRIARLCGVEPGLRIVPFRGEYYDLAAEREQLVRNLIYPVPDPEFPFLGVHFTRMINGGVEAGPNAVLAFKRTGYKKTSLSLRDCAETFTYGGFWRMIGRHGRMGMGEFYRSFNKRAFAGRLARLIPEIRPDDLRRGGAGVRAQAVERGGGLVDDFRIVEAENMIHVLNAPSPAATASISIGRAIAARAVKVF